MNTWSYGINSLYKTASIDLRIGPWWVFALERTVELCCDMIPSIPLPDTKKRLKDQENIELNGCNSWTTWKEWYGDLSQLFHCFVHVPIFDFCQKRIKCKFIELDYDKVKEMFYQEDKRFWDEEMNL
ncbi:MAG: hypothetical protein ABIJ44_02985 [Pseudomonadota bacterium]